ncbi:MAG: HAD family hydrolase [Clostridia bacterium]|nr:HAD family hydrolase [Clostridia bacterium]
MEIKRILFFDLDGTLWNRAEQIPLSTREAIRMARANGHEVWINTGRSRAFVDQPQLFELGIDGAVTGAGTMIETCRAGQTLALQWEQNEVLSYHAIPDKLADETIRVLREHRFYFILEGRDNLYCDVETFGDDPFVTRVARKMGQRMLPVTGNEGKWRFEKISCELREAVHREEALSWLGQYYEVFAHHENVIELVPLGFTKGTGLLAVCEKRQIPVWNSVAFGDGRNDVEMFDAAGVAIAMGNGSEIAFEHADMVTEPYDEDGIWLAMRKLGVI